ncbi:hypothetical protein B0H14DRAFT_3640155 [Mycena olivaceomarginata]|nr:hypothetical protein B0H14DRAFT_3640155 [Mycena olivaceomarginata]
MRLDALLCAVFSQSLSAPVNVFHRSYCEFPVPDVSGSRRVRIFALVLPPPIYAPPTLYTLHTITQKPTSFGGCIVSATTQLWRGTGPRRIHRLHRRLRSRMAIRRPELARFHSLGSRECIAITTMTYSDAGTHRWSLARVDVSFDWTRMRRGNGPSTDLRATPNRHGMQMHLLLVDRPRRSVQLFIKVDKTSSSRAPPAAHALFCPPPSPPPFSSSSSADGPQAHRTCAGSPLLGLTPLARSFQAVSALIKFFHRLYAHPEPLRPAPLRCAMVIA